MAGGNPRFNYLIMQYPSSFLASGILFIMLNALPFVSMAQVPLVKGEQYEWKERIFFGGNFGLGFGNIVSSVALEPLVGVMLGPSTSVGVQGSYTYINWRRFNVDDHVFGYRGFLRQNIPFNFPALLGGGNFVIQGEVERMKVQFPVLDANNNVVQARGWVPGTLIGPGVFYPNQRRGGFHFLVLYNFSHDRIRSPYGSEVVLRVGFIF
jgi:hypothetical protein